LGVVAIIGGNRETANFVWGTYMTKILFSMGIALLFIVPVAYAGNSYGLYSDPVNYQNYAFSGSTFFGNNFSNPFSNFNGDIVNSTSSNWCENNVVSTTSAYTNTIPEPATVSILGIGAFLMSCGFLKKRTVRAVN